LKESDILASSVKKLRLVIEFIIYGRILVSLRGFSEENSFGW
jgi:hypothetical protein